MKRWTRQGWTSSCALAALVLLAAPAAAGAGVSVLDGAIGPATGVVRHVRFSQTEADQVEVMYDLAAPAGTKWTVELWLSQDGGESFTIQPRSVRGDVGEGVLSGTGKRILWDVFADIRKLEGEAFVFKVVAQAPAGSGQRPGGVRAFPLVTGAEMEFVWIEPGTFTMGSPASEVGRDSDEGPQHQVTIRQGFWLGKCEVTQGQWQGVMGTTPWSGQSYVRANAQHPAVYISWDDAQQLIARLNAAAGSAVYRLPTEAEWEYACRAGSTTRWSFGDDEGQLGQYAWYCDNAWNAALQYAQPVGTKLPNPWGLYDMHGNVWEWCQDWYGSYGSGPVVEPAGPASGSNRVIRSGGFNFSARYMRSAYRNNSTPGGRLYNVGVRLLRTP